MKLISIFVGRISLTLLAFFLLLSLSGCPASKSGFKATDITGSSIGGHFELPDHAGKSRQLGEFKGKLVIVTFGFTSCPDVCPTTLQTLALARKALGPDAGALQVMMITADPARDSRQIMSQYVPAFDPTFIGLIPTEESLKQIAGQFKVYVSRNKPNANGSYSVDHTAASFVFDRAGRIRLYVPHTQTSDEWAADLRLLLRERGQA